MSNSAKLRMAIWDCVDEKCQNSEAVDIGALALTLSSKYPQSGMTLGSICAEIEAAIKANGTSELRPAAE
jgi:hypothetical protein